MLRKIKHFFGSHRLLSLVIVALAIYAALRVGRFYYVADLVIGISAAICAFRVAWDVYQEYKIRKLSPDALSLLAVAFALALRLPLIAVMIVTVVLLRKIAEDWTQASAKKEISNVIGEGIRRVTVLRGRKEIDTPLSEVQRGFKLLVKAGELFPVDGLDENGNIIISGTTAKKDTVLKASSDAEGSQHHQLVRILRSSIRSESPFAKLTEKFIPLFMIMSLAVAGAIWHFGGSSEKALAVLAVAAPTPLVLAAPLAVLSGLSNVASKGIFVRNGKSLELLATARTFVANKGTKLDIPNATSENLSNSTKTGDRVKMVEAVAKRPVAFVGLDQKDGPTMTAADLGISLSELASNVDATDVFILSNNASLIRTGVKIARYTFSIAALAVLIGVCLSVGFQIAAATGKLSPIATASLQLLVDLAAILTTLKIRKFS